MIANKMEAFKVYIRKRPKGGWTNSQGNLKSKLKKKPPFGSYLNYSVIRFNICTASLL